MLGTGWTMTDTNGGPRPYPDDALSPATHRSPMNFTLNPENPDTLPVVTRPLPS